MNGRYKFLKSKISKIMKSSKYTIINQQLSDYEFREYLGKVENGVMNILTRDLSRYINKFTKPITLKLEMYGEYYGLIDVKLNTCQDINLMSIDKFKEVFLPIVKGYFETFISETKANKTQTNTEVYVDAIMKEYFDLTEIEKFQLSNRDDNNGYEKYYGRISLF